MKVAMSGLDYNLAPVELRERLSFTKVQVGDLLDRIKGDPRVSGCVIISTCNRTEIYITCADGEPLKPAYLLCEAAGERYADFAAAFVHRNGRDAVWHLMEVAGGLQSQIWGDDQIITQVKTALELAQSRNACDPVLATLFRDAVAAGKEIKTSVRLTAVPDSVAFRAIETAKRALGDLHGLRAVVMGNGEMGRLSARLLREAGCSVVVTLRTYRHGETVVPSGCAVISYEQRLDAIDGADIVLSATTSPHYTLLAEQVAELSQRPRLVLDLAIPRDIDPRIGMELGIQCYNVDTLGGTDPQVENQEALKQAKEILERQVEQFYQWWSYKNCLPLLGELKEAITDRVLSAPELDELTQEEAVALAVRKTVDLLTSGMKGTMTPQSLRECRDKIVQRTRPRFLERKLGKEL
jgi:glutamyl-tRNA reductase